MAVALSETAFAFRFKRAEYDGALGGKTNNISGTFKCLFMTKWVSIDFKFCAF